jgi:hypothetical protein
MLQVALGTVPLLYVIVSCTKKFVINDKAVSNELIMIIEYFSR